MAGNIYTRIRKPVIVRRQDNAYYMKLSPEFDLAHADATSPAIAVKIIAEVRHATDPTLSYARRSLPITMRICDLLGYIIADRRE